MRATNDTEPSLSYEYRDADGQTLYVVERAATGQARVRRPVVRAGRIEWLAGVGEARRALYRLPELLAAGAGARVYVVAGEPEAEQLARCGLVATTCLGGLGRWRRAYAATLSGREVVILTERHAAAQRQAAAVAREVQGYAASVRVLSPSDAAGDLFDWLATVDGVRELEARASTAPVQGWSERVPVAIVTRLSDVAPEPVPWLWPGWLPRGSLALLGGHPGDGKSTLTAAFAATLSRGGGWPDGARAPLGATLFLLAEDALATTLRPRLEQHGADLSRVAAIEAVRHPDGSRTPFSLAEHLAALERRIVEQRALLVVIDPLSAFLPSGGRGSDGALRALLTPLAALAERREVAILGVMHVGKPGSGRRTPLQSLLGATAFGAVARLVLMVAPVPDPAARGRGAPGGRKALAVIKSNVALKPAPLEWSRPLDGAIVWHGESAYDTEALVASGGRGSTPRAELLAEAEELLRELLKDGPVAAWEVEAAATEAGIAPITLKRARKALGVRARRLGGTDGTWHVMLPGADWEGFVATRELKGIIVKGDHGM